MTTKIAILVPNASLYRVLQHFALKLHEALLRAGINSHLVRTGGELQQLLSHPPNFTLGFNGVFSQNEELFCDILKIPHIACLVDPSFRFLPLTQSPYAILACDDLYSLRWIQSTGCSQSFFFPHAVEKELLEEPLEEEKIYDITLLATYIDHEELALNWKYKLPSPLYKALMETAEQALVGSLFFADLFDQILEEKGLRLPLMERISFYEELELYIKGKERTEFLKAFSHLKVHLFGSSVGKRGWREVDWLKNAKNIVIHPPVHFSEAVKIIKKSKILLNGSAKNRWGAHERIFTGIALGALVVTEKNRFLSETFGFSEGLIFFHHANLTDLESQVESYLKDETIRANCIEKGREIVLNHHTWDQRVPLILNGISVYNEKKREGSCH